MENDPFPGVVVSSFDILDETVDRQQCAQCNRSRKYFCYTCLRPLPSLADKIPHVRLPFKVDIVKHPRELDGKSTAVHAAILAPLDVTVYQYPDIPDYANTTQTVLVFPSANAISLSEYVGDSGLLTFGADGSNTTDAHRHCMTVVFIDCTWYQVNKITVDSRLRKLQRIELKSHETKFWRPQVDKPATYLSTIEAIYYCAREFHELMSGTEYCRQYDDLLFFFIYFYHKIQTVTTQRGRTLKAYTQMRAKKPRKL